VWHRGVRSFEVKRGKKNKRTIKKGGLFLEIFQIKEVAKKREPRDPSLLGGS